MKWAPDNGFFLLDRHLNRLARSASHFDYAYQTETIQRALERAVASAVTPLRIRLRLAHDGTARIECTPLEPVLTPARLALALAAIDPTDVFLYHKTTHRTTYERARRAEFDDVILWNPASEVTESTVANVVAEIDGRRVTPPVSCGLLAGTFREQLLDDGVVEEAVITTDELRTATRVWLVNSVREWWPAVFVAELV